MSSWIFNVTMLCIIAVIEAYIAIVAGLYHHQLYNKNFNEYVFGWPIFVGSIIAGLAAASMMITNLRMAFISIPILLVSYYGVALSYYVIADYRDPYPMWDMWLLMSLSIFIFIGVIVALGFFRQLSEE